MVCRLSRVRNILAGGLALGLLGMPALAPVSTAAAAQDARPAKSQTEPLSIRSKDGTHRFDVEVMRDDAGRQRGLMFRRTMAPNHGMLFDFERSEPVAMWMKNTYLPLDMLFIRSDGSIAHVAADTEPLSTAVIASSEPVLSVLELNAGTAAKLGIKVGDRVEHPLFQAR